MAYFVITITLFLQCIINTLSTKGFDSLYIKFYFGLFRVKPNREIT